MRKILLLFTALLLSATAMAHDVEIDGIYYNLESYEGEYYATVTCKGESSDDYKDEYSGDVVIPSSITYNDVTYIVNQISDSAFDYCSVSSILVPNSVNHIGAPNNYWYGVENIHVSSDNEYYSSEDGVLFDKDKIRLIYFPGGKDTEVRSYSIPEGVVYIGQYAFDQCSFLSSVTIPNTVTSIGSNAFAGTDLVSVTIPNSVTSIGSNAFGECRNLESVIIGNKVEIIGYEAFANCHSLTSIAIPNSVKTIETGAFYNCTALTAFVVSSDNEYYSSESGVLFNKDKTELLRYPIAKSNLTSYTIPNGVKTIASGAFEDCNSLTSITIPNSVITIGKSAFYGTGIWNNEANWANGVLYIDNCLIQAHPVKVEGNYSIKEGTTVIANYAFNSCDRLTSVTIPGSIEVIPDRAFTMCTSLETVTIPNSVTSIGAGAFEYCNSLTSITIPNSVTSIGGDAFADCHNITSVAIGENVTSIGNNAFLRSCENLKSLTWNAKKCANIEEYSSVFSSIGHYDLFSLIIGEKVEHIPSRIFSGMHVTSEILTLPNSLVSIGEGAFSGNTFGNVNIPKSLTTIGADAFASCTIGTCHYNGTVDEWVNIDFGNMDANPMSKSNGNHINGTIIYEVETSSATAIKDYAFANCQNIVSLKLGGKLTSIGEGVFSNCQNIKSLELGENITSVGVSAFENCVGLESVSLESNISSLSNIFGGCTGITSVHWNIKKAENFETYYDDEGNFVDSWFSSAKNITTFTFGDKVEYIPAHLCKGMDKLTSITIPNNVTAIGRGAFTNCSALTSVTLSNKLTLLNDELFQGCSGLKTIEIPNSVTKIGYAVFNDCTSLETVKIPDSVTSIGEEVFEDCSSLKNVELSNNITAIGYSAFEGCTKLTSIKIPSSVLSIKSGAFAGTGMWNNEANWENGVLYIDNCLIFAHPDVMTGEYVIKENTRIIAAESFYGCEGLTSIVMPEGLKSIDDNAFGDAVNLESFNIPNSVVYMGYMPFYGTAFFVNQSNWDNAISLYKDNCLICSIAGGSYSIKEGTRLISGLAFWELELTSLTIPSSVKYIGPDVFMNCEVSNVIMKGDSVPQVFIGEETADIIDDSEVFEEVSLYVPCKAFDDYKANEFFALFENIQCLDSEETELKQDDVVVDAGETSVLISWPKKDGAETYTITITNNDEVICTLDFNENGQLISINFVTERSAMAGFTFKVTGLEANTQYAYQVVAKDADNAEVASYSGEFTTAEVSISINETLEKASIKVSEGTISCDADFSIYNLAGQDVTDLNGALQSGIYVVAIGEDKVKVMVK